MRRNARTGSPASTGSPPCSRGSSFRATSASAPPTIPGRSANPSNTSETSLASSPVRTRRRTLLRRCSSGTPAGITRASCGTPRARPSRSASEGRSGGSMGRSRQFRLAARPEGEIKDSDFELVTAPIPEPAENEFVIETTHISIDPAMRGWMSAARSYIPPVKIGEVMRALAVGRVIASHHPEFAPGDWVHGPFGVQEHAVSNGQDAYKIMVTGPLTPAAYLGVLGLTGLTAYFGLLDVGRLSNGDTVLVSGAAGGVGTAAGQIAKIKGATAVGIAGAPEKCRMLIEELGFDGAVDYKRSDLRVQLHKQTPDRVDVFFDNVGGEV